MDKAELKQALRKQALLGRDGLSQSYRSEADRKIMERLFKLTIFACAKSVLFYASFRTEVDTHIMIEKAIALGKKVMVPKVDAENGTLSKHHIRGIAELSPGYMGIPEPTEDNAAMVEALELKVIPGVAFGHDGQRIGYGGGYYDRLLKKVQSPIVALAYEAQIMEELPIDTMEPHDVAMDYVITENRIINCN